MVLNWLPHFLAVMALGISSYVIRLVIANDKKMAVQETKINHLVELMRKMDRTLDKIRDHE